MELFWWVRRPDHARQIRALKHNPHYLSSIPITLPPENISSNLKETLEKTDWVLLGIPAAFLEKELEDLEPEHFKGKRIISVIKGMVPGKDQVIADYMKDRFHVPMEDFVVLTGPCHAEEISQEKLSYLTIACLNLVNTSLVEGFIKNHYIRTQPSRDIYGTEYASVLKNIISLASGIFHGLGYGDNFQAVFVSNAIQEIAVFMDTLFPMKRDINDSAYLGDLLVTAYSQFSRNRTFGTMIGKGYSIKSAQLEMNMVAEGYYASASMHHILERNNLNLPITETVFRILYQGANPAEEMEKLSFELH